MWPIPDPDFDLRLRNRPNRARYPLCAILWSKICEQLNIKEEFEFFNSLTLYRNRHSEIVHTVLRILCPKQCYFFPEKCLFSHGYDFKNLLRKDLHERFNPEFENLFKIKKIKK